MNPYALQPSMPLLTVLDRSVSPLSHGVEHQDIRTMISCMVYSTDYSQLKPNMRKGTILLNDPQALVSLVLLLLGFRRSTHRHSHDTLLRTVGLGHAIMLHLSQSPTRIAAIHLRMILPARNEMPLPVRWNVREHLRSSAVLQLQSGPSRGDGLAGLVSGNKALYPIQM
ncbi:hypothetical protein BASA62_003205 [Batrachochytrium salamandrivorans]|nr:hypothetical protein BASA62_003205 [Batrachochytrium salamandrivorans]